MEEQKPYPFSPFPFFPNRIAEILFQIKLNISLIMAASFFSVAAAASSSSSSSLLHPCNRISNFTIDHDHCYSPIKIRTTHFSSKFKPTKTLILSPRIHHSPLVSLQSPPSAALDSWEAEEENQSTELQESEASEFNKEEKEEEGEEEEKFQSIDNGRLFVGNLPYAITSSQLIDTFGEAGRVLSVEVGDSLYAH